MNVELITTMDLNDKGDGWVITRSGLCNWIDNAAFASVTKSIWILGFVVPFFSHGVCFHCFLYSDDTCTTQQSHLHSSCCFHYTISIIAMIIIVITFFIFSSWQFYWLSFIIPNLHLVPHEQSVCHIFSVPCCMSGAPASNHLVISAQLPVSKEDE